MKIKKLWLTIFLTILINLLFATELNFTTTRPNDFINIKSILPQVQLDLRYYSNHNFIGKRITGYNEHVCLVTKKAAEALIAPEQKLLSMGLTFKVYDCYRPQMAVNEFYTWSQEPTNFKMQQEFYASVPKNKLFKEGYIALSSGHSRGSTLDLTIVPVNSSIPQYNSSTQLSNCVNDVNKRFPDNSLDFGTGYDCFDKKSWISYKNLTPQQLANRLLFLDLMQEAGFKPFPTEWWHFTLIKEPYPNTYFNFPIEN
jgi:D-alanyl-D-alanine dipeptidase